MQRETREIRGRCQSDLTRDPGLEQEFFKRNLTETRSGITNTTDFLKASSDYTQDDGADTTEDLFPQLSFTPRT